MLSQIASNFANEYFDYRDGIDAPGREGPRRGVTEGDISPRAMLLATFLTLALACCAGIWLLAWGGYWLVVVGVAVALGVFAYSAGPWPLSRHALGEVAVLVFYGLVPVTLTCWLTCGRVTAAVWLGAAACGLMACNILIVNNYRDIDDDRRAAKTTLATLLGRNAMQGLYLFNGYIGVALMIGIWLLSPAWTWFIPAVYLALHTALWVKMCNWYGRQLNRLLGMTACLLLAYFLAFLFVNLR